MTKAELIQKLQEIVKRQSLDPECDHVAADELLLHFIDDTEVNKAYAAIEKWYA